MLRTGKKCCLCLIHKARREVFIYISANRKLLCNVNCSWSGVRCESNSIALAISAMIDKVAAK